MLKILADALLLATRMNLPSEDYDARRRHAEMEGRRRREQMTVTNLRF
jgi:hypothetical protein